MRALPLALVIALLSAPGVAPGQLRSVDLAFEPPSDARVIGFHVYLASSSSAYGDYRDDINYLPALDGSGVAHYALAGIEEFAATYVSLRSYDASGAESVFSNEIVFPADPGQCNVDADCPAPSDPCAGPSACVAHLCQAGGSPEPDETFCNDGNASTPYDVCRSGVCRGFACGVDAQCSDGDACDGSELCVANACAAGTPPACPTDSGPCFASYCDASAGCAVQTYPDGTACTTTVSGSAGTCSAGVCQATTTSRHGGRKKR